MIPDFQKKDSYVRRFQNEMMQADERRNQALFIPDKGSIVVSVVSAGQHLVIERHNVTDKQAVMDSIHAELEAWMFSGGRDGTCNVLSVDLVEPKKVDKPKNQSVKKSGVITVTMKKNGNVICPVCLAGEKFESCSTCKGTGEMKVIHAYCDSDYFDEKFDNQMKLTHEQVRNLRANGFID